MKNFFLVLIFSLYAQLSNAQFKTIRISSEILDEEREIMIGLPLSYSANQDQKYPLIILTDAEWHFQLVYQATQLIYQNGGPKVIVAGIVNTDRSRDLTISSTPEAENGGGAKNFKLFIETELLNRLQREFRISNHRTLLGHSAGGLFASYCISENQDIFDAYVTITPTIRWDGFKILESFDQRKLSAMKKSNEHFFLAIGNETGMERDGVMKLNTILKGIHNSQFSYAFTEYNKSTHVTVPWKGYFDGLNFIFSGFNLPKELEASSFNNILTYFENLGNQFDYDTRIPQRVLLNRAYAKLELDSIEEAIQIFTYYSESYPHVPIPLSNLGDIYFNKKEYGTAKEYFDKAFELFPTAYVKTKIKEIENILHKDK